MGFLTSARGAGLCLFVPRTLQRVRAQTLTKAVRRAASIPLGDFPSDTVSAVYTRCVLRRRVRFSHNPTEILSVCLSEQRYVFFTSNTFFVKIRREEVWTVLVDRVLFARVPRDPHVPGFGQENVDEVQRGGPGTNDVGATFCFCN